MALTRRWPHGLCALAAALATSCGGPATRGEAPAPAGPPGTRVIRDMRGVAVTVPRRLSRVATIDDGFVESVMTRLGTIRTLVAVGSSSQQRTWSYSYPADGGRQTIRDGMGTMRALHPWIAALPCAARTTGDPINYETIARSRPQVAILRAGDCTLGRSPEAVRHATAVLESIGIPVVVLRSPSDHRNRGLETLREEIRVLGRLFEREGEAVRLADELSGAETMVRSRAAGVPERQRPRALYLGLAPGARSAGGAAYVWGRETAESWMLEQLVGARNAYLGPGARVLLSLERLLALDPDVIFLPTAGGYHSARELSESSLAVLRRLRAVREGRVYVLPWTPMNCARRLEYPIDLLIMAKAVFPDRFADVVVHDWIVRFYRQTYGVGDAEARRLRRAQWLEWTAETAF